MNKPLGLESETDSENPSTVLLDDSQLDQFRANDNDDMLSELVSMYLTETDGQIGSLKTQQDPDTVARIAHQLKGSSANLGARQLADAFSRLEASANLGNLEATGDLIGEIQGTFDRTRVKLNALLGH